VPEASTHCTEARDNTTHTNTRELWNRCRRGCSKGPRRTGRRPRPFTSVGRTLPEPVPPKPAEWRTARRSARLAGAADQCRRCPKTSTRWARASAGGPAGAAASAAAAARTGPATGRRGRPVGPTVLLVWEIAEAPTCRPASHFPRTLPVQKVYFASSVLLVHHTTASRMEMSGERRPKKNFSSFRGPGRGRDARCLCGANTARCRRVKADRGKRNSRGPRGSPPENLFAVPPARVCQGGVTSGDGSAYGFSARIQVREAGPRHAHPRRNGSLRGSWSSPACRAVINNRRDRCRGPMWSSWAVELERPGRHSPGSGHPAASGAAQGVAVKFGPVRPIVGQHRPGSAHSARSRPGSGPRCERGRMRLLRAAIRTSNRFETPSSTPGTPGSSSCFTSVGIREVADPQPQGGRDPGPARNGTMGNAADGRRPRELLRDQVRGLLEHLDRSMGREERSENAWLHVI